MKADRRLWFTADRSRLVEDGDGEAAFLAYAPGATVAPADRAKVPGAGEEELAEAKRASRPADKSRRPAGNKGRD